MDNDEKAYRKVDNYYKEEKNSSFGKSVVIPFLSGILGSALVVGTCFGIPSIKTSLIGNTTTARNKCRSYK